MPRYLAALALLVLAACARSSEPPPRAPDPAPVAAGERSEPGSPAPCTAAQEWFTPAAGADPLPADGCYTRCDATTCPSGQVCRSVSTNPCGATEDGQIRTCDAFSQQTRVCLPA